MLQELEGKRISKEAVRAEVEKDFSLVPELLTGTSSSKANVRYGCGKVLMDLSEKYPDKLYPYMTRFIELLDSKYRILTWNAMAIIANLARVDKDKKFEPIFPKYFGFLNDEYMVTVSNLVGNSAKIALAKPHLIQKITKELLKIEKISTTPHLTEECKRVIIGSTILSFDAFFDRVEAKAEVLSFVKRQLDSQRASLRRKALDFVRKWG